MTRTNKNNCFIVSLFRLPLLCLHTSTEIQFESSTATIHLAIHAALNTMNPIKISIYLAAIHCQRQMFSSWISKSCGKHWNCVLNPVQRDASKTKTNCIASTRKVIANCVDMILICHFWSIPYRMTWITSIYLDRVRCFRFMKGERVFCGSILGF